MTIKMRLKMKNRSSKYDISRPDVDIDSNILNIKRVSV